MSHKAESFVLSGMTLADCKVAMFNILKADGEKESCVSPPQRPLGAWGTGMQRAADFDGAGSQISRPLAAEVRASPEGPRGKLFT